MTHETPVNYNLNVSKTDTSTQQTPSNLNLSTTDSQYLMRLLALCGQDDDAGKKYNLSISSSKQATADGVEVCGTTNTSLQSNSATSLSKLLSLAGVSGSSPQDDHECGCESPEPDVVEIPVAVMEQQAAYDYGDKEYTDEQEEFTITDYNFRGRADLPERLTSARFGSNALKNEMKESAFDAIKNKYLDFLNENRENEGGMASPFTANARDEFEHDPLASEKVVDDGTRSPLSRIKRQELPD